MKPKLLLLTLLLALTLAACTPARSEPESGSEVSAPSSQAEEQPSEPTPSEPESSSEAAAPEESSVPESQKPRTLPDWIDESFCPTVEDWAWGELTSDSLLERYGDLVVSDRYFSLSAEDGTPAGWIQLSPSASIPETVPVEMFYQNSARLEQFRENYQAGKPDQLVYLSLGRPLLYGLQVYTFDGETLWWEYLRPDRTDSLTSVFLTEAELVEGNGWWQIRSADDRKGIFVPEKTLSRWILDLEDTLRQAEEAGYVVEQYPADRNGIPCTYYQLWNSEKTDMYYSFFVAEDGSCWFYSDEVNGNTRLAVQTADPA